VLSLGALKNGGLSSDAIVCFDTAAAAELHYRTKRTGHVASKMRFQSVQLERYLTGDLWLRLATTANRAMDRLAAGLGRLGVTTTVPPEVNMAFVQLPEPLAARWEASGIDFYRMGPGVIRLVTSFQTSDEQVDTALERLASVLAAG
jgi:threonine aldolase